ncbi:hypothetical protein BC941DRAFT_515133 [Chlamydoabsidia padenii]|nr:hypothetical protein BC941DRAFT_515133 [Chlamydoabsidia padenii]
MKSSLQNQDSLSIELLPEFGTLLNGKPVFGPGSVFQGIVHVSLDSLKHKAQRLSLVFHAAESVQRHSTMDSIVRARHDQLFGTQRILWAKSTDGGTDNEPQRQYRFTIQLPMIQYPPSMEYGRLRYKCDFKLTAILEQCHGHSSPLLTARLAILYRPWVPTKCFKSSPALIQRSKWAEVQLTQDAFLAGDTCQVLVSPSLGPVVITLALAQLVTLLDQMKQERVKPLETILTRSTFELSSTRHLSIIIPADTPPTCCFGRTITVGYALVVRLKKSSVDKHDIQLPLVIGTLGYGVSLPEGMKQYTDFDRFVAHGLPSVPVPQFLTSIEYESAPPSYLPSTLPPYSPS